MGKSNIKGKNRAKSPEDKRKIFDDRFSEFSPDDITISFAFNHFILERMSRGNAKASIDAYNRFYKKLVNSVVERDDNDTIAGLNGTIAETPVKIIASDIFREAFILSLSRDKPVSQQTINHYLRSYRAFGNFCEEQGYLVGFKCPIKEIEPPLKDVYTEKELKALLKEPDLENFVEYRSFAVITLVLTTGARSRTILNIKLRDVDLERGYIKFTTTKAHRPIEEGLDTNCIRVLTKYIKRWRSFSDTDKEEYLFCNVNEEQLSRNSLCKSIAAYNNARGVEKTSLHLFRHTFAKMWITNGGDIITLARVLTHSELEMVKRYANLYGADVKSAIEQHSAIAQLKPHKGYNIKSKKK